MISLKPLADTNILEIQIDGAINAEEFDQVIGQIEAAIQTHGKVKLLKQIGKINMPPIPWSKFWDDLRFAMKHLGDFTHVAVVADQDWVRAWSRAWSPLLKAQVKAFELSEIDAARQWLQDAS